MKQYINLSISALLGLFLCFSSCSDNSDNTNMENCGGKESEAVFFAKRLTTDKALLRLTEMKLPPYRTDTSSQRLLTRFYF